MANRPYAVEWDEANPGPGSPFSQGDNRIREVKTQIREIFEEDHNMDSNGSGDEWGYHDQVTLMEQTDYPTVVSGAGMFFTKEVDSITELFYMDDGSTSQQLTSDGVFIGGMMNEVRMWSGTLAELTSLQGWELCETPDLIGKFIMGVNTSTIDPGTIGGTDAATLTEANLPIHTHTMAEPSGRHEHDFNRYSGGGGVTNPRVGGGGFGGGIVSTPVSGLHTHSAVSSYGTGTNTIENRPVYYELAFIKRS